MKLGVMTLAIMNVAAVVSLRGLPAEAVYGLSSAFYYLFAAIALGFVLFLVKGGPVLLTIGVILIGLGYGCMQPIIYDKTSTSTAESHATFALALVMAMNYMAIITYPFILEILQGIFSTDTSYFPFLLSTILAGIFAVFTYFKRNTSTLGIQIQR